jgi:hypothetical protein
VSQTSPSRTPPACGLPVRFHEANGGDTEASDAPPVCAICLEELDTDAPECVLPCKHRFHSVCLLTAFRRDERCPLCRTEPIERAADGAGATDARGSMLHIHFTSGGGWEVAAAHDRALRNYTRRARRAALHDELLLRLRSLMRERQRASRVADDTRDRTWVRVQNAAWRSEEMAEVRSAERLARRRFTDSRRRYEAAVALRIGAPPVPEWTPVAQHTDDETAVQVQLPGGITASANWHARLGTPRVSPQSQP